MTVFPRTQEDLLNSYSHTQSAAAASWTVTHNLDCTNPIVIVYDSSGEVIYPDSIVATNADTITITLSSAITGTARITTEGSATLYSADTIEEANSGEGVTIDGVLCKDREILAGMLVPGQTVNIGLKYASNTLTICQANGSDLADTDGNRGYICMGVDGSPGLTDVFEVTSNSTLTDGDASDTDDVSFGITLTADWGNAMPMFLYAINDNSTIRFGISRDPTKTTTPAATYEKGNVSCNAQDDMMILHTSAVNSKPCICIGSFRWVFTTTNDYWTIQTLVNSDGIGRFQQEIEFVMPVGQNGAQTGQHFKLANYPTWAIAASIQAQYSIKLNGCVNFFFSTYGAGACTNGADANAIRLVLPYENTQRYSTGSSVCIVNNRQSGQCQSYNGVASVEFFYGTTQIPNNALLQASDDLQCSFIYRAF